MAFKKNPDSNPSGGGPNDSCWNMKGYNVLGPNSVVGGPGTKPSWNVRFDWQPSSMTRATTYRSGKAPAGGLGGDGTRPTGNSAAKVFSKVSNAPKGT